MKTVYLVRHGESEGNVQRFTQSPTTPLSEAGRIQATHIADRCAQLGIEHIVASTMTRAADTAQIISNRIHTTITYTDLLVEKHQISTNHNRPHTDPEVVRSQELYWKNFEENDFRIADEENFNDLKNRAREALYLLENRPEETLLVVSHGLFLRIVFGYMLFGDQLSAYECRCLAHNLKTTNTGLSKAIYNTEIDHPHWSLIVWNDHAHLGE